MIDAALAFNGVLIILLLFFAEFSRKPALGIAAGVLLLLTAYEVVLSGIEFSCGALELFENTTTIGYTTNYCPFEFLAIAPNNQMIVLTLMLAGLYLIFSYLTEVWK